jgi:transposase
LLLQQKVQALEQQIAAAQQERQHLLDEFKAVRPIRMNPDFPRERRRVDEMGRALAAIEIQLDSLYAELQDLLQQQGAEEESGRAATPSSARGVILDNQGHDQDYWQQRLGTLRERLQQARQQRQIILEQLGAELPDDRSFGRRGEEVLQLVQTLEQLDQEIPTAEAEIQALRSQAASAGAPAAWLR